MGLKLQEDGSGQSVVRMGVEDDVLEMTNEDLIGEMEEEFSNDGYDVEEYDFDDDKYQGIEGTKSFDDINSFSFDDAEEDSSFEWTSKSSLFKKTYIFEGKADPDNLSDMDETDQLMADQLDFNFFLVLPFSPSDHNADTVEGKQLMWEMDFNDTNEIYVEGSKLNYLTFVIIGIVIIAGIVFFIQRRKKNQYQTDESQKTV